MVDELARLAESAAVEHPYLGDGLARRLREMLPKINAKTSPHTQWMLHYRLGRAEQNLGNLRTGIEQLVEAYKLIDTADLDEVDAVSTIFHLGVAYMRLGETENCCKRNSPQSCVLPIRGRGIHVDREGSTHAIRYFEEVLSRPSQSEHLRLEARWLLNIMYMTLGRYPDDVPREHLIPTEAFEDEIALFALGSSADFTNVAGELGLNSFNLAGGAIADDFDNDGYLDLIVSSWDVAEQIRFFHNDRDGTFSDRTASAGLGGLLGGLNLVQADYDNDGHVDFLILRGAWAGKAGRHPNSLVHNNGDGTFTDVTFDSGLGRAHYPTQTAGWADYDHDGDVDLYIGNENTPSLTAPCQLFRNNGDGTFTDKAVIAGVSNYRFTKGVTWGDVDGDRYPDLYLSNYGEPNRFYRNNRDGTFTDVAPQMRMTDPIQSFPVWFWDFDNDGGLDLFVSSYAGSIRQIAAHYLRAQPRTPSPTGRASASDIPSWENDVGPELLRLYRGDGRGGFREVAEEQKLTYPILPMGSNFGDVNNDGYLDFYLGTGASSYASLVPNLLFLNQGGRSFTNVTMSSGTGHLQKGHGVAFADLDNDGDPDIFEQMGGAFPGDKFGDILLENPGFGNHWLGVKLVGRRSNVSAIGARIHARFRDGASERSVYRHVNSGGSFGANPLRQTLGLGQAEVVDTLEVYWPTTDTTQTFHDVAIDQVIRVTEDDDAYETIELDRLRFGGGMRKHGM